jgi:hypothetical protein
MSDVQQISDPEDAKQWTADRIASLKCEERGEGLNPSHVYVNGSGRCQCGKGPDLSERRMK